MLGTVNMAAGARIAWWRLHAYIAAYDIEPLSLMIACANILWGVWVLSAWGALSPASYHALLALVSARWIGALVAAVGLVHLTGLLRGNVRLRRTGAFGGYAVRMLLFFTVGISTHWLAAGLPDFALWTAGAAWCFLRIPRRGDGRL